jgi:translation initiation factor IF-2
MATTIEISDPITVGSLAEELKLPVSRIITELMKSGVMATVNERIDFDTAQIIVEELGIDITLAKKAEELLTPIRKKKITSDDSVVRPPVVAVMGHVDHGKTSLLDAIRGAEVVSQEAGGITQHISAYQIEHNKRAITFLDTPGHEAFAAIREHGALLTDIVIIVVAADDGVKPQTVEAIRFATKAGARIIVAINKIDKEGANANQAKQQLSEHNLLVEEWGGDIVAVEVSAKTKQGIDQLLDMILLVADVEDLRADIDGPASGLIIEAHVQQGRGPLARALVESGTLRKGQFIVTGGTYAKIRTLEDSYGNPIQQATPSAPVTITGFKALPEFGDEFEVADNEKIARRLAEQVGITRKNKAGSQDITGGELIRLINRSNQLQEFNIILKADVQGSLASVSDSLKSLDTEEVATRIVKSSAGIINESDIHLAQTSGAVIYGFHVDAPANIKRLASRDGVQIRLFRVIYELIDDVRDELTKRLVPEIVETETGRLVVRGIFKTSKTEIICGGEVTKGKLTAPALARIVRDSEVLGEVEVTNLKRGPQDTKEVFEGEMCGMNIATKSKLDIQEGDRVEVFTRETVARSL